MGKRSIDLKSLATGFLMGVCLIMAAARAQEAPLPAPRYEIAMGNSTWIIDKATGDVWELDGEEGASTYTWTYAGRPASKSITTQGSGKPGS
jgi:hypothetical protein